MTSDATPKTVLLKGCLDSQHTVEGEATSAITPGHLILYGTSTSELRVANVAATTEGQQRMFALENDVAPDGYNLGAAIDQVYAVSDRVYGYIAQAGDHIYALVNAGASAIVFGDLLESALDGSLAKVASGLPVARALEAVDNSGGSAEARIKVE